MANYFRRLLGNTKVAVHILVCVFAIASWIDLNGMWAELPLLTQEVTESWNLPSYITIISQVANIGPLLFVLVSYFAPQTKPKLEKVTSFIVIIISMVASFLMAFFWQHSSVIGGTEHSTALLALNFFLALGDCTSSLSFYAFMSHLKPEYMASLFIGEGLSGMLPGLIALGQGAGDISCNGTQQLRMEPNFSVKVYFIILSAIIACSAISFLLLNLWGYCKTEMVDPILDASERSGINRNSATYGTCDTEGLVAEDENHSVSKYTSENCYDGPYIRDAANTDDVSTTEKFNSKNHNSERQSEEIKSRQNVETITFSQSLSDWIQIQDLRLWKFFILLAILIVINMTLTTFLSTIQIYSVRPYGLEYYHLATTLTLIANPVTCFFALFFMARNLIVLIIITVLGQGCVAYITYMAALSPQPPLHGTSEGGQLSVAIWILVTVLLVYAKVCVAGVLRQQGRSALIWAGVATQVGSLIGAVVGFLLTTEYALFTAKPNCPA